MEVKNINEDNYLEFIETIKELVSNNELNKAEEYLLKIIFILENISIRKGIGVSPGFYMDLAKIYKKQKNKDKEREILHQYLIQHKPGGSLSQKIFERYLKIVKPTNLDELKDSLYEEYQNKIILAKLKTKFIECSFCKKKIKMVIPSSNYPVFRGTCPRCYESNLFIVDK